jgi:hypothetical protein
MHNVGRYLTPEEKLSAFAQKKQRSIESLKFFDASPRREERLNVVTRTMPGGQWKKVGETVSTVHVSLDLL